MKGGRVAGGFAGACKHANTENAQVQARDADTVPGPWGTVESGRTVQLRGHGCPTPSSQQQQQHQGNKPGAALSAASSRLLSPYNKSSSPVAVSLVLLLLLHTPRHVQRNRESFPTINTI